MTATATISGDFGSIKIIPQGADSNYVVSYDEKADKAGEGSAGSSFGLGGATGESIGYQFPSLVDGLTLAVQHSNVAFQNHSVEAGQDWLQCRYCDYWLWQDGN